MRTLRSRLLLIVTAVQALVLGLVAWAGLVVLQDWLAEETRARAEAVERLLTTTLAPSLATRDFSAVRETALEAVSMIGVVYLDVIGADGIPVVRAGAGAPDPAVAVAPSRLSRMQARGDVFDFSAPVTIGEQRYGLVNYGLPARSLFDAERKLLVQVLAIGAAGLMFAVALLVPVARLLTHGLARLGDAAERVRGGELDLEVPVEGHDEVARVAAAFNRMSAALAERVAALEESEARQRTLFEALAEGVVFQDANDRILACNAAAPRILGLTRNQILGLDSLDPRWQAVRRDGTAIDGAEHPSMLALRTGQPQHGVLMGVHQPDGTRTWISVNSEPLIRAGETRPYATVTSFSDITARVVAEERLQQLNVQLEQRVQSRTADLATALQAANRASHAKSEFLSRMSHELRTPLNAILGFAQVLQLNPDALPGPMRKQVQQIEKAGWHLLELINEVLDLSRVEAGALRLSIEPVDVCALGLECLRLNEPAAASAQLQLQLERTSSSVIHAQADRTRLRQVLMNLLSNAIKYNRPAGSVTLRLALDGDGVLIAVADTGRGFSPEQLQRIYEPFNRLGAENDLTPGTGIGLVITRRLVELMNGTIELRTEPGRGAEFIVRLPRASAAPQPAAAVAKGESAPTAKHRRRTLLYVEDNPSNVDLLAGVLTMRPHLHMVAASDGATGLAQARVLQPDLIVLDIALPDVDGYEVCRQLRADGALAARPIIALSANAMPADITRGSEAGFDAYLTKPLDVPQFLAHLDRLLRD